MPTDGTTHTSTATFIGTIHTMATVLTGMQDGVGTTLGITAGVGAAIMAGTTLGTTAGAGEVLGMMVGAGVPAMHGEAVTPAHAVTLMEADTVLAMATMSRAA